MDLRKAVDEEEEQDVEIKPVCKILKLHIHYLVSKEGFTFMGADFTQPDPSVLVTFGGKNSKKRGFTGKSDDNKDPNFE